MSIKLSVVSGSRADYGLLKPLIKELLVDPFFELRLIITGGHLLATFGSTYQEILDDGFNINAKINIDLASDSDLDITKSTGSAIISFSEEFNIHRPDLIIVLGDRYEIFSATISAFLQHIPIAHIHGGEVTEGAVDDAIRHSITKMSCLHFVSTAIYQKRVIQMGEDKASTFLVGALAIDNITKLNLLSKKELEVELGLNFENKIILVTYHPVTLESERLEHDLLELLDALNKFNDHHLIITSANADHGGVFINSQFMKYAATRPNIHFFSSLGNLKYLSLLQFVECIVGNSSSGFVEAPFFKIGTVNIGSRQKGRIILPSIINCEANSNKIIEAIKLTSSNNFKIAIRNQKNIYGSGDAAKKIINAIKSIDLNSIPNKKFHDIDDFDV